MPISYPPTPLPQPVNYVFVDAGCLRATLKNLSEEFFGGEPIELDYPNFLHPFTRVYYYDALPPPQQGETAVDHVKRVEVAVENLDRIAQLDNFHVYEGDSRRRKRGLEVQKKVDVKLAVDMLTFAYTERMDTCTLIASDLDFEPLLIALVARGTHTTLWYPEGETNSALIRAADVCRKIDIVRVHPATSLAFQQRWPRPVWNTFEGRPASVGPGQAVDVGGPKCEMSLSGDDFVLLLENEHVPGSWHYLKGRNWRIARGYIKSLYGRDLPLDPP